ncbi:butyrophilin subfamily 1 member A1-like [Tachysurus vachellii]|uniref:butyrophilin subfamily 1 member A1-like n=1 Tax=Tachysurus vachellii TaxID=175792 RepID=UPI00296A988B|nr:butyrophilin subfamily 1 member A1-like [Tachysurus vachellii]
MYALKWRPFHFWCNEHCQGPDQSLVGTVLEFRIQSHISLILRSILQPLLQATNLSSCPLDPLISFFQRCVRWLQPTCRLCLISWYLSVVLRGLLEAPFKPLKSASEKFLTVKMALLQVLASLKGVGDLQVVLIAPCMSNALLHPRAGYVSKVPRMAGCPVRGAGEAAFTLPNPHNIEHLQVFGPEEPLVAVVGEDLVLPCFIKPNTSVVDMTVEWFKLYVEDSLLHLYRDHKDKNEGQAQSYRGRTSLFKEELQKGNASLKLSDLRVSDEGKYKCLVEDKSWSDDITVNVIVEAQGSNPVITMESFDNSGGINLVCESSGWNPEPDVLWLDREGVTLTVEDTQIHRDTEGFSVKSHINVYDYSDSNSFYCKLQQQHHMLETEIIINSKVFDAWKWIVGISVSACLIAVGLIVTAIVCNYHKEEIKKEKQSTELQRLSVEYELLKKKQYSVDVTLDPDTAHPDLILFADGKQVRDGDERQNLPDTPQRFNTCPCVLGKQSFSSGRFYYEVQVRGKTDWSLGVARENINRKGQITLNPQNGFWTVVLRNNNQYEAYADLDVPLTLREKVEVVGVFVDYEEGLVSFYDVKSSSDIYSFTGQSFTEKLYPYFSPGLNDEGKNSAPLIISPVFKTE